MRWVERFATAPTGTAQLVLVFVVMPDERSAELSELQFLAIQLPDDPRFPVVGHLRQLLSKINFAFHVSSFLPRAEAQIFRDPEANACARCLRRNQ
jgi:hypothetical protein